jgi:PAS domain S-box-containing protein
MNNEHRIAEEAVRESEQRWRSLTEALPQLVWSATPDGACDYFSTQWTEYTGVAESELLGWRWMGVLHPDDRESTRQFWTDSVAGRRAYDVEYRVRRHDGAYGWFKTRGVPIRDSNGDIVKWFGTCTDITDGKRAEEALRHREQELRKARNELEKKVAERTSELRRSEAYLAEAQRLSHTGSWALTVATREIVHLSDQFYQIFGLDPERGMPSLQTVRQLIHPEDRFTAAEIVDKAIRKGKGFELDYRIVLPEGTIKFIHVVAHPVFNTSGDLVEFLGTVVDVTERKRAEEDLRESERRYREGQIELAHVNRVTTMGQLTASIAHEVNQPIAAAVTNADAGLRWLAAQPPNLEEVRDAFVHIIKASNQASEVVGRIRALIKKLPARKASLDQRNDPRNDRPDTQRDAAALHLAADRARERSAAHLGRPSPTATGDPELDHERHRSDERGQRGIACLADRHGCGHAGRRDHRRTRFGPGIETGEPWSPVRSVLHDQTGWHGDGIIDLSFDNRSARWTLVGDCECTPRRGLSVHPASRPCILKRCVGNTIHVLRAAIGSTARGVGR